MAIRLDASSVLNIQNLEVSKQRFSSGGIESMILPKGTPKRTQTSVMMGAMVFTAHGARTEVAVIVQAAGRVDGETAPEMSRVCHQWITPNDRYLILDLSQVQYISSAGLSSVLGAGKEMSRQGGELLICGLNARLKQVFTFSGFETLFAFFEDRDAALVACSANRGHTLSKAAARF